MNPVLPIAPLILLFALILAFSGWSAWNSAARATGRSRFFIPMLRLVSVLCLAAIAFNPGRWDSPQSEQRGEWAVMLDSSLSMATRDVKDQTRWSRAVKLAQEIATAPTPHRPPQFFQFDSDLQPVESLDLVSKKSPDGESTDIMGAGLRLLERYQSSQKHLEGVVLITDGRQVPPKPSTELEVRARTLGSPIYPVILGGTVHAPDLAIATRRRQYVAFKGQSCVVTARLTAANLGDVRPTVVLLDESGSRVAEKQVSLRANERADVRFDLDAADAGYRQYRLRLDPWPGESALANNECEFGLFVVQEKIRVLLVEGNPYWDSKFIAQLLQRQNSAVLTLIYRLTQEKYFSLGTSGGLSDDAVLHAFPDDLETLSAYDLVVVGKGFEYFVNAEKANLLRQFVRDRGGCLLFARGKAYAGEIPALGALEPISWEREWSGEFSWQPTLAGEETGLFAERLPGKDAVVWAKLPPLSRAWEGGQQKAFAQVLAEGVARFGDQTRRFPVVVSQRHGKGLVVAINSDDLWQWDFFPKFEGASEVYQDFWLQLMHWAVAYSEFLPGHDWSLRLSQHVVERGEPVRAHLASRLSDARNVQPVLRVFLGGELIQEIAPAAVPDQAAQWETVLTLDRAGTYRVEMAAGTTNQQALCETLAVKASPAERDDLNPDRELLDRLAANTGGRVVSEQEVTSLFTPAPQITFAPENTQWVSAWDRGAWLLVVLSSFALEWFLRRRNGLT